MAGHPRLTFGIALTLLFAISFAVRAYPVLVLNFDGLYGQDSYAYYGYGQQIREAFAQFELPDRFYWPLGYPILVALGFLITGQQPLGPQLISLMAGALVSLFAFLITYEIARQNQRSPKFSRLAALIAWAVTAACGQLIQSSMVIMADAAALMWASLSAYALLRYGSSRRSRWVALSACALAWATMTRWQYGSLALIWALYVVLNRPLRWRDATLAAGIGILTFSPQIIHTLQNPGGFIGHMWVQGWSINNAFALDFVTADGTFHYTQSPAIYYLQPLYNGYYLSPLLLPFLIIGILVLWRHLSLIVLIGWSVSQYLFLAGIPYENIRFALAIFPPLAVLIGLGIAWMIFDLKMPVLLRIAVRPLVILVLVYSVVATLRAAVPMITDFVAAKNSDLASAQWIEQQIPESGAAVYCLDLVLTMQHYTTLHPVQIYEMTPELLSDQLQQNRPAYAVFNLWTTEHQWNGESPWIIYHWLLDQQGMVKIGTTGNYTLYRINP
jgi:hypothetical protein